jgi:hypothetical protein
MTRQGWRWFAVVAMMIVTFLFGTDAFSSENTRPIIDWIMSLFFGPGPKKTFIGDGEGLLRKSAHFIEYALLAFVWYRALRGDCEQRWSWAWAGGALVITALWASVDELQQGFISAQRTGNPWDVLLDTSGAATALILVALWSVLPSRPRRLAGG